MVKYDSSQLSIQNDEHFDHRWILWRGICILGGNLLEPTVYGEWWKHVSCISQKTLNHLLRKAVNCEASQGIAYSFDVLSKDKALINTVFKNN